MYVAAVFLPLLGAIITGLFGRAMGDRASQLVTCGLMLIAAVVVVLTIPAVLYLQRLKSIELHNEDVAADLSAARIGGNPLCFFPKMSPGPRMRKSASANSKPSSVDSKTFNRSLSLAGCGESVNTATCPA